MKYPHNTYGWIYVSGEIFTDIIVLRMVPPRVIHGEQFSYLKLAPLGYRYPIALWEATDDIGVLVKTLRSLRR